LREALTLLSKKYTLGIISNYTYPLMLRILKGLDLPETLFSFIVTADMVTEVKPSHEPLLKALELANAKPAECLFVGDSPNKDMLPAKEVGMKTILVSRDPTPEDLKNTDASITDVKQIVKILID
jgi:HAD superfamily hydrolase (TIGR01549 family)